MQRRTLIQSLLSAPLLGAAAASAGSKVRPLASNGYSQGGADDGSQLLRPRRLEQGMTVGLVTPASNAWEDEDIRFAGDVVRSLGFEVKEGKHLYRRTQYLAGPDEARAEDMNYMFADPDVDAVFCLRGGYGTPRILPMLDYQLIRNNPKVLLGYSDITALLNAIYHRSGMVTFHGPIAAQNFTDYTLAEYQKVLVHGERPVPLGTPPPFEAAPGRVENRNRITRFAGGRAQGRLIGGNLSLMVSLVGTPFEPDYRGKILFLEDVGEAPYRVDRMLTQLWLAGKLQQVAGIVFGKFTEADSDGNTFSMEHVLRERTADLGVPVVRGLMIGHVKDQTVVPVGALAELDGDAGTLLLRDAVVS
ncbi:S66 peptidase family protein [Microbulbifer hydrolyticus]|uniref:Muramoyltetrapeptide carboxypeptidase n=2 Tax=Microbulbifer hydrolyticus TaxID=48074 RepID=A0AA89T4W4_9GAMM|nr:LD-carboxypeptidase [Microbulbifer hydrolyticus]MBB5210760.1 muramoyltetrapeptide carboxypeptidase [Microbulbifer hydrolyticus]